MTEYSHPTRILTNLTEECRPIIKQYWQEFDAILDDYNNILYGYCVEEHNTKTIKLIQKLKTLPQWKSNLFILYLHFQKVRILADKLKVNKSSLSVYLSQIKKELKC